MPQFVITGNYTAAAMKGMIANGYEPDFAERCFKQLEGFGEYGFPESFGPRIKIATSSFSTRIGIATEISSFWKSLFSAPSGSALCKKWRSEI